VLVVGKKYFGIDIDKCKYIGKGYEGKVYLTPDGSAIKIFKSKIDCEEEYNILKKVDGSNFFPKVFDIYKNCILREYVAGIEFDKYLKKNEMSKRLAVSVINLIQEFYSLGFTKINIVCKHIFVQGDESIKVIDPRKTYTANEPIPVHILKEIDKSSNIDFFIKVLIEINPKLGCKWFGNGMHNI
jgi:RIO-like serine/threonine protein kinase